MQKELSDMLQDVIEDISEVLESVEDKLEDAAEEVAEDWEKARTHLHTLNERAHDAKKHLEQNVGEANLQAHLAMMEASQRADAIKDSVSHFINHAKSSSKNKFDHARVQSKLAQMEARDFAAEAHAEISEEVLSDAEKLLQIGVKALEKLRSFNTQLKEALR